eukprot:Pompholyxophrys_punicea_v1_NODE_1_length_14747_cov_12.267901.p5 type:complete len:306 gc:universal NODE_1_length_14747_cov_12.267901:9590-10507(+)
MRFCTALSTETGDLAELNTLMMLNLLFLMILLSRLKSKYLNIPVYLSNSFGLYFRTCIHVVMCSLNDSLEKRRERTPSGCCTVGTSAQILKNIDVFSRILWLPISFGNRPCLSRTIGNPMYRRIERMQKSLLWHEMWSGVFPSNCWSVLNPYLLRTRMRCSSLCTTKLRRLRYPASGTVSRISLISLRSEIIHAKSMRKIGRFRRGWTITGLPVLLSLPACPVMRVTPLYRFRSTNCWYVRKSIWVLFSSRFLARSARIDALSPFQEMSALTHCSLNTSKTGAEQMQASRKYDGQLRDPKMLWFT